MSVTVHAVGSVPLHDGWSIQSIVLVVAVVGVDDERIAPDVVAALRVELAVAVVSVLDVETTLADRLISRPDVATFATCAAPWIPKGQL